MKRTALKRKTRLKAHKGLNKVSDKQGIEIQKRQQLKADLIKESGEHCMTCKDENRDWRGISLSHIIPLSRGGKTERSNVLLECYPDHDLYEKHPENRPLWQQIQAGVKSEQN